MDEYLGMLYMSPQRKQCGGGGCFDTDIDFKLVKGAVKGGNVAVDGEFSSLGSNQIKAG